MPYKYFGRTTDFRGQTLWEIVGNLKNFGVGRILTRSMFERYPEPTYFKILKVEALPCPENPSLDNLRRVRVWTEKTFRGVTNPKPVLIVAASYKTDYKLIPKSEEASYCNRPGSTSGKILPRTMEFPPILKELLLREMKAKGEDIANLELEIVYQRTALQKHRIAKEGETPDIEVRLGIDQTRYPSLYQ